MNLFLATTPLKSLRPKAHIYAVACLLIVASLCVTAHAETRVGDPLPAPPSKLYGDLFTAVQMAKIYPDQKTFADATPKESPVEIMRMYEEQKKVAGFSLDTFVAKHFTPPSNPSVTPPPNQLLREHIDWLWPALTRTTLSVPENSSLIPVPKPYVVPGGRFRESYYWDTYFTMLGLQESGHEDLVVNMLDNFAYLIDTVGHIPNGTRTYYMSRSQPPFFSYMVELAARKEGAKIYSKYLPQLRREHEYWMHGEQDLKPGKATDRVVMLPDNSVLNRYWDALDTPRDESYMEDVETAKTVKNRPANEVFRDLRAAAESGWDFSSRWFGDSQTLATIRTTSIIPVDLNSLMFHLEVTIVRGCHEVHDIVCVAEFERRAKKRKIAINTYLWNKNGYYGDYDWTLRKSRKNISAAMLYPLFAEVASPERAHITAKTVRSHLLKAGGLATTTFMTTQQWDAPNGWAPLQWIAVKGLREYGENDLAKQIGTRFLSDVNNVYSKGQKLVEKYLVEGVGEGGGGEYPLQDGFGWTNGVTLKLIDLYGQVK